MTDEEMKRLEEIAKAATPGPWIRCGTDEKPIPVVTTKAKSGYQLHSMLHVKKQTPVVYDGMRDTYNRDAAHIAAANPAAVLALIERVRKADGQLATIAATLEYEGPVEGVAQAVKEYARASVDAYVKAERKGAEEMRKAIVVRLRETARGYDEVAEMMAGDVKAKTDRLRLCARAWEDEDAAEDILTLRLPGDAP